jgi:hypothetical protein
LDQSRQWLAILQTKTDTKRTKIRCDSSSNHLLRSQMVTKSSPI